MQIYPNLEVFDLLAGGCLFLIIFTCVRQGLRNSPLDQGRNATILAVCTSLLAVLGLGRNFTAGSIVPTIGEGGHKWDFLLLPYVILALAILLIIILLCLARFSAGERKRPGPDQERNQKSTQPRQGRPPAMPGQSSTPPDKKTLPTGPDRRGASAGEDRRRR